MDTVTKKANRAAKVTLIVGLAIGLGISVWSAKTSHASTVPGQQTATSEKNTEWDPLREMERMQEEIDRAIRRATRQFEAAPNAAWFHPSAGYSSSFDLEDRGDHYELRAYLPDVKASDVNVKIDNDRTLHVSITQRKEETKKTSSGSASFKELGKYEQVVTLPEPVRSSEMKIERHDHEVLVTIPKANPT
jgi:HSP20 family molecular chaperone IbpA